MKFLLGLAALTFCAMSQNQPHGQWIDEVGKVQDIQIDDFEDKIDSSHVPEVMERSGASVPGDDMSILPKRDHNNKEHKSRARHGKPQGFEDDMFEDEMIEAEEREQDWEMRSHRGHGRPQRTHLKPVDEEERFASEWDDSESGSDSDSDEKGEGHKHRKGHGHWRKGRIIGKGVFFLVVAIISFALIKKCVKRKKKDCKKRMQEFKMLQNPSKIDDKIGQHYEEIRKLEEIKQRALTVNQGRRYGQNSGQFDPNPIIYHYAYSQNQPNQAQGTLINENYMPRQPYYAEREMSENVQYPDIPVGRPLPQQPQHYQPSFRE